MDVTMLHNPACSTCRSAVAALGEAGVTARLIEYLKQPMDAAELRALISILADPVSDLVRRDRRFKELGLSEADVSSEADIVNLLVQHPELLQRPILKIGGRAYLGRPKERVPQLLAELGV